jgi:xanthine dehydrogenase accessory factor
MDNMMSIKYLDQMRELSSQGQPFVLATVVRIEKPTSSKPGAKAIITQDGNLTGWVGGSCAEPSVKKEAAKALQDGRPRLLRLCPPEKMGLEPQEGVTELTITCTSGGTLEIYLEPYLVQPHLLVIGHMASAEALAALGKELDYTVTVMGSGVSRDQFSSADQIIDSLDFSQVHVTPNMYVVVASHGNYDELALEAFLPSKAPYVALLASKKRSETIRTYLRQDGMPEGTLARLKYPAGLDFGAVTPAEIALSILAEIIQHHRRGSIAANVDEESEPASQPETALDPVCEMTVEVAGARYTAVYNEKTYYFCSAHCQHLFEKKPEQYLQPQ